MPGEVWPLERIKEMKSEVEAAGLRVAGIESFNIHDSIKIGTSDRENIGFICINCHEKGDYNNL